MQQVHVVCCDKLGEYNDERYISIIQYSNILIFSQRKY